MTFNADTITLKDIRGQAAAGLYFETAIIRALPSLNGDIDELILETGQYSAAGGQLLAKRTRGVVNIESDAVRSSSYREVAGDKRWYSVLSGVNMTEPFAALMHIWQSTIAPQVTVRQGRLAVQHSANSEPLIFPINADAWSKIDSTPKVARDYATNAADLWAQTGTVVRLDTGAINEDVAGVLNTAYGTLKQADTSRTPAGNTSKRFLNMIQTDGVASYLDRTDRTRV